MNEEKMMYVAAAGLLRGLADQARHGDVRAAVATLCEKLAEGVEGAATMPQDYQFAAAQAGANIVGAGLGTDTTGAA